MELENKNYMNFVIEVLQYNASTLQEFLDFALDKAIELTQSKIGYIYHYNESQKQFVLNTWSKDVMKECSVMNPQTIYDLEKTGFWGEVVRQRKDLILNDFQAPHPKKKGIPEGHVTLSRFMSIPIFKEKEIVAVVGMGNKESNYTDDDLLKLRLMMDAVWKVVDQKKVEEDLRKSEQLLQQVFDSLPIGLWFADKNGKLVRGNPAGVKIWGAEPKVGIEEYGVFKARKLPSGKELAPQDWALARTIRDGVTITDELLEIDSFDGKVKTILNHSLPVKDSDGNVNGAIVINQDVTEKRSTEEGLRKNEEKYRIIAENMGNLISMLDMDFNYTYVSPNVKKILGYSIDEYTKLNIKDTLVESSLKEVFETFQMEMDIEKRGLADPDRIRIFELEEYKKDGSTIWMENVVSFIRDENGMPTGFLTVSRDINERKEAEKEQKVLLDQLIMAQKMESIGRLAGGIAHDFNNMLSVIMGRIELLLLKIDQWHPFFNDFNQIKNAAERSANLTAQLLAFARKQVVAPKVIDLNDSLHNMLLMMKRLIGENIELKMDLNDDLWSVKIDPTQLDQVVANLIVNAKDAVKGRGKVIFNTRNESIYEHRIEGLPGLKSGDYVVLSVSDDGCGMSEDIVKKVFEPFFTTKEQGEGTGLGLSTIYGIVKQNEGYIYAFSEKEVGTEFRIYFPKCLDERDEDDKEESLITINTKGQTILFVEDEPSILEIGSETLENFGYNVLSADTPRKALDIIDNFEGTIDLLISDVIMPEMNGRELEVEVKKRCPEILVIFMSGYTSDVIAQEGVITEETNFIQKPFSQKVLSDTVRRIFEGR